MEGGEVRRTFLQWLGAVLLSGGVMMIVIMIILPTLDSMAARGPIEFPWKFIFAGIPTSLSGVAIASRFGLPTGSD